MIKLSAVCVGCGAAAAFTKRTVAGEQLELVGGAESYVPMCRGCFGSASSAPPSPAGKARGALLAGGGEVAGGGSGGSGGSSSIGSPAASEGDPAGAAGSPSPPFLQRLQHA